MHWVSVAIRESVINAIKHGNRSDAAKHVFVEFETVTKDDVPFLIMHGTADTSVPLDQSERLHAALQAVGVESTLKLLPGAGHGGREFDSAESRALIQGFLDKHLKR